jgi:hypothetical protein
MRVNDERERERERERKKEILQSKREIRGIICETCVPHLLRLAFLLKNSCRVSGMTEIDRKQRKDHKKKEAVKSSCSGKEGRRRFLSLSLVS